MTRSARIAASVLGTVVVLGGCTAGPSDPSSSPSVPSGPRTSTHTVIRTRTSAPGSDYRPPRARTIAPLPPGRSAPAGESDRRCPYIKTGLDQDGYHVSGPNVADIEGDRIYRTTVLTRLHPVGCRFYFYAPPYEALADIVPRRFGSATIAHNALVRTAQAGTQAIGAPDFARVDGHGVDGISYRTRFFGADRHKDWAFAFAVGRTLVVVRTQRDDTSRPALYLGRAIVGRF